MVRRSSSSPIRSPTRSTLSAPRPPPTVRATRTKNSPTLLQPPTSGFAPSRSTSAPMARSTSSIGTTKSSPTTKSPARTLTATNPVAASGACVTSTKAARRRPISRVSKTARSSPNSVAPTPSSRVWLGSKSSIAAPPPLRPISPSSPLTAARPTIAASPRSGRSKVSSRFLLRFYVNSRPIPRPRSATKPRVSSALIRVRKPICSRSLRRSSPILAPPCAPRSAMRCGAFPKPAPASSPSRRASAVPRSRPATIGCATNASSSATSRAGRWK